MRLRDFKIPILLISVLLTIQSCDIEGRRRISYDKDVIGFWDLTEVYTPSGELVYFRSGQFYFDEDGSSMVPRRLGIESEGFDSGWKYCEKQNNSCIEIFALDPFFNGKWKLNNKVYSHMPNYSEYLMSFEMCRDTVCLILERPRL